VFTTAATRGGALTPGVALHASLLTALRRDTLVRPVPPWLNALLSMLLVGVVAWLLGSRPWRTGLVLSLAAGGLYLLLAFGLYVSVHRAIGIGAPLVAQGLALACLLAVTLWDEEREKQRVRATFGRYVSPKVIDKILKDPVRYHSAMAERREITVLFVDLAGFTSFAERTAPEQVQGVLNAYLREMTACILAEDGILDKYLGDGVMAVWGGLGSTDPARDAARAMAAALMMQRRLAVLNQTWREAELPPFDARIGIHSGEALVGNFGSDLQVNFTAVGDVVNVASRLEALNKQFGTAIIVSGETVSRAGGAFRVRPLGSSAIRGRSEAVEVFELLSAADATEGAAALEVPLPRP
jgi:adenylate cyclase